MAIYHLEAKVVSRGNGRSACAASAYMSCSQIYNNYDGIQHDYTRKQGLVWQRAFLPENAQSERQDREKLWNAVEANEKTKDSRLAREFVVALKENLSAAIRSEATGTDSCGQAPQKHKARKTELHNGTMEQ